MDIFIVNKWGRYLIIFSKAKTKKTCRIGWWSPRSRTPGAAPTAPRAARPLGAAPGPGDTRGGGVPGSSLPRQQGASAPRSGQGSLRCQIEALWSCMPCLSSSELAGLGLPRRKRDYISQSTGLRRVILTKARLGIPLLGAYPISTLTWRQLTIESWDAGGYLRLGEDLADFPPNLLKNENASQSCSSWGSSYGFII